MSISCLTWVVWKNTTTHHQSNMEEYYFQSALDEYRSPYQHSLWRQGNNTDIDNNSRRNYNLSLPYDLQDYWHQSNIKVYYSQGKLDEYQRPYQCSSWRQSNNNNIENHNTLLKIGKARNIILNNNNETIHTKSKTIIKMTKLVHSDFKCTDDRIKSN